MHADSSTFKDGLSKRDVYAQVLEQARILFDGQRNWVRQLSFLSSPLHFKTHEADDGY